VVLGLLAGRRDELGRARTQAINRIHRLLLELLPGGAKKFLSAARARALIAAVRPRDVAGKTRRRLAAELITELEGIDRKIRTCTKEITVLVEARGSALLQLHGIGPSSAARLLADVGNIHRFASGQWRSRLSLRRSCAGIWTGSQQGCSGALSSSGRRVRVCGDRTSGRSGMLRARRPASPECISMIYGTWAERWQLRPERASKN
jgi:transposase